MEEEYIGAVSGGNAMVQSTLREKVIDEAILGLDLWTTMLE